MGGGTGFTYDICYARAAEKFFRKHEDVRSSYEDAIRRLITGDHPEMVDVKRIKGKRNNYYRIRLGDWRVIYAVIKGKIVVITTLLAGSRWDVYKKMDGIS